MATPGESYPFRAGVLISMIFLGFLAEPMIRGQVLVNDDLSNYYIPFRAFYVSCLEKGDDPAWCPNLFGGFYLQGEGTGFAHPLVRLLYVVLPLQKALNVELLASYPALLAGFVLLLLRWGVRRDGALFGGLLFAFGGYNLLHFMHLNVLAMLAHVPWLLLSIDVALRSEDLHRRALARVSLGFLTASQLLLAHVQFAWISGLGEVLYAGFLAAHVPGASRRLAGLAVSKALGILGGSAQVLPLWDAFVASRRERPSMTFVAMGSLPPSNLLQWVAPYLSVSRVVLPPMNTDAGILIPADSMRDWRVHEFAIYYGAVVPTLLIWLAMNRNALGRLRPLAIFAVLLAVVSLVLAFGDYTPLFTLTAKLPVVGRFRLPARYLVLFHLAVAMLAALGFSVLCGQPRETRTPWRRLWPLALPTIVSLLVCLGPELPESVWPPYLRGVYLASIGWRIAGPVLILLATVLVAFAARGSRVALVGLLAFAAADQAVYGAQFRALYPPRTLAAYLEARPAPPVPTNGRVTFDQLHEANQPGYTMKGLRLVHGYVALMPRRQLKYDHPASLRVAGVGWRMPTTDEKGQPWVPVPDPLPRVRLVTNARASTDPNRDLESIDVVTTALVEAPLALRGGEPGRARMVGDRPGKLDVITEAGKRQLLVVSESHHDGWRVKVDGHPQRLLRVNGDFIGCVVPPGKHHVQLRFLPTSARLGAWLSILGLVLVVAAPIVPLLQGVGSVSNGGIPAPHQTEARQAGAGELSAGHRSHAS